MSDVAPVDIVMDEFLKDRPAFEAQVQQEAKIQDLPASIIDAATWLRDEPPAVDPILVDTCDKGDKVGLIGATKTRKSFCCLQLAVCEAAGRDFLAWKVPGPRRVLAVQLEIQEPHYWRRVRRMCAALGVKAEDLGGRLHVVNGRGKGVNVEHLKLYAERTKADIVIVDPLYKLNRGDENSAENMAALLAWFDDLAQATGAAVVYVHHDAKGTPGDRETRDRGSGSGVLGRDYDACITLTEHRDEPEACVVQALLRNYPPQTSFVMRWEEYAFRLAQDLEAVKATSKTKAEQRQRGHTLQQLAVIVQEQILTRPWRLDDLKAEVQGRFNVGRQRANDVCQLVARSPGVEVARTNTFPVKVLIGPPKVTEREAVRMTAEWRTREL